MKRNIKFLFVFTIFLILIINTYCFAIDMNLPLNNTTENTQSSFSTNSENTQNNDSINSLFVQNNENYVEETAASANTPSVVTTTSNSNDFLTIDNIISIILIAIGIVLILFGIAIFVRFK